MTRIYAEYDAPAPLVRAIAAARTWGPVAVDAYTPYALKEIDHAVGGARSWVSKPVLAAGVGAALGAYGLQWLLNAYLYPLDVGGRPPHFPLSFVPITFEMGVLFASFTAVISVFIGSRLLRLWDPSRDVTGIESATATHFWLELEVERGPEVDRLVELVHATEPLRVEVQS